MALHRLTSRVKGPLSNSVSTACIVRNKYRVRMPRYYFHIRDSKGLVLEDCEGFEFTDSETAEDDCRHIIESVLNETEERDHLGRDVEFQVVDEHRRIVLVVPFHERAVSSSPLGPRPTK